MTTMRPMFDREYAKIRADLQRMSGMVTQAIGDASRCFVGHDKSLAQAIVDNDAQINECQRATEEGCLVCIATQQPVASDLRNIVAALRIADELERIADHAADIAQIVGLMECPPLPVATEELAQLGHRCRDMLTRIMAAYQLRDDSEARRVAAEDNGVDKLEHGIIEKLLVHMRSHPDGVKCGTHMLWVAHNLERIGDRVTNIAERIIFMNTGDSVDLNQ